jgi:hypothetical protein
LVTGCERDRKAGSETTPAGKVADKPDAGTPWTVRVGAQGGFTGGGSGHLVHSNGTVQAWSQIVPNDSISFESKGRTDEPSLAALLAAITAPDLVGLQHEEVGNMTVFLSFSRGTELRRWSWAERADETKLPPPLEKAYDTTLSAIQNAKP